jgi:hypothetical protein
MSTRGRPRLLNDALVAQLTADVELGVGVGSAAKLAGVDPRSLRRWRAQGRRELAALSCEARLALALDRAQRQTRKLDNDWQTIAKQLSEDVPERWADRL